MCALLGLSSCCSTINFSAIFSNDIIWPSLVQNSFIASLLSQSMQLKYSPACSPLHTFPVITPIPSSNALACFHALCCSSEIGLSW